MNFLIDMFYILILWLVIVGFWLAISGVLARGGWSILAENYSAKTTYRGKWQRFWILRLNNVRYRNIVRLGYDDAGIFLDVFFLFKFHHPQLFIPKAEIEYKGISKIVWWEYENFGFTSCPTVTMKMRREDGEKFRRQLAQKVSAEVSQ